MRKEYRVSKIALIQARTCTLMPIFALCLAACQPTIHLMRAPVALSGEFEPYQLTPDEFKISSMRIAYATNRLSDESGPGKHYSRKFDQNLRFGRAFVQIGSGEENWDQILDWSTGAPRDEKIPLSLTGVERRGLLSHSDSLDELTPDLRRMFDAINNVIDQNPFKDITVYVHGANANFYRAASQAAQYHHFSGRTGLVIFYAWPTGENFLKYSTDLRNIEATRPVFERFIRLLAKHTQAEKINILAYSAGAKLASDTLESIGSDTGGLDLQAYRDSLRLGSVYFAAADVELSRFTSSLRKFVDLTDNVTLTYSEKDSVLRMSSFFSRASRAGSPDVTVLDEEMIAWSAMLSKTDKFDVVYIDPEVIPDVGRRSHSYWYTSSWVSSDALLLLYLRAMPSQRGLVPLEGARGYEVWTFPDDYDRRVAASLDRLASPYFD